MPSGLGSKAPMVPIERSLLMAESSNLALREIVNLSSLMSALSILSIVHERLLHPLYCSLAGVSLTGKSYGTHRWKGWRQHWLKVEASNHSSTRGIETSNPFFVGPLAGYI
jgi:hypothetical protein